MNLDFTKNNGLIPAIIQNANTMQVLMLGYMNEESINKTKETGLVTFYSRSKKRLWMKGETSGNTLRVVAIKEDCDSDSLLIKVLPNGPVCHTGSISCFGNESAKGFLYELEKTIAEKTKGVDEHSYTNTLFRKGINKIAQKVGEEAVELIIESKDTNTDLFSNEAADLLYHFLILLRAKNIKLEEIENVLLERNK